MKTNLRERLTRYRCFIRPKAHLAPEFSFNDNVDLVTMWFVTSETPAISHRVFGSLQF